MPTTAFRPRHTGSLVALTAAALVLTGCASAQVGEPVAMPGPPPTSAKPTSTSRTPTPTEPAGKATKPLTPAGAALKFGEEGVVEFESGSKVYTVGVSPTKVEKGSFEELASAGLKIEEKTSAGKVPYYVNYKMVNRMEGSVSSMTTPSRFGVLDKAGRAGSRILVLGVGSRLKLDKCAMPTVPRDWSTDQEYTGCDIHLLPEGQEVASVLYRLEGSGKTPIAWTA
ncbi:hypothetical protein [Allokutzneria oryzae]|uniref:Lipoprotein n=1 Tax=Allokutzneria oryzae TaxID=1378989 RepID=A0ABV5ZSV9_9PSEU